MKSSLHKGLLILTMLALALTPMRAAWSMPDSVTADTEDHCAQMRHDSPAAKPDTGLQDHHAGTRQEHPCNGCCGSDCNPANCNDCAHGATAANGPLNAAAEIPASPLTTRLAYAYPERSITPPLRPPASV